MQRVTPSALADHLGVNRSTISRAIAAGKVTLGPDGLADLVGAVAQFQSNRRRRRCRTRRGGSELTTSDTPTAAARGDAFWDAKTRREQAEAALAELKAAEMRGELVRRLEVERAVAGRLVALRESLESLADRLAALMAAETDPVICRRLIRDEHRQALANFVETLA